MTHYNLLIGSLSFCVGFLLALIVKGKNASRKIKLAKAEADKILNNAARESETIRKEVKLEIKDQHLKMKSEFDTETRETRSELNRKERWLIQKEENVDKKLEIVEKREREIARVEKKVARRKERVDNKEQRYIELINQEKKKLEEIGGMTSEQAKNLLIKTIESEAKYEGAKIIKKIENETTEKADKKAKEIIATAIQRYAGDFVAERTVSVVALPSDDMKGRIIGREGRNIRALESSTGIDIIIDDTPEAVILSGFNPVRREVARLSLLRLISDGRIHPARIEDIVDKVTKEVDQSIKEAGERATFDLGVHGINSELIKYIGQLQFRTSYGQNVLQHSVEVGFLSGIMAAELGLNEKMARRMGLLHDLGKAVDHEVEGPHALIGSRLAKKFGESPKIIHAIATHHDDVPPNSVYALLLQAADGLSGARPGARREVLENYIKRIEDLENIANSFNGVTNSYAIQAGRELRVIAESGSLSDEESILLSRDIVKKIEETLTFPGQIKVTVIRETRAVDYANK